MPHPAGNPRLQPGGGLGPNMGGGGGYPPTAGVDGRTGPPFVDGGDRWGHGRDRYVILFFIFINKYLFMLFNLFCFKLWS